MPTQEYEKETDIVSTASSDDMPALKVQKVAADQKSGSIKPIIAPSILSSDFAKLAFECERMVRDGADWLHLDVMDGHFVPNITLGAPVVRSLRKHTKAFLDCHLMVSNPEQWVDDFKKAGADMYTFHIEATDKPQALIDKVKKAGMQVGMALKPGTKLETVLPYVDQLDLVLLMTVEPGFGGQKFNPSVMSKVKELRAKYPKLNIEVDGGVNVDTIQPCAEAGANVIVSGSGIFDVSDPAKAMNTMRKAVQQAM